jgi:hypothetical protein
MTGDDQTNIRLYHKVWRLTLLISVACCLGCAKEIKQERSLPDPSQGNQSSALNKVAEKSNDPLVSGHLGGNPKAQEAWTSFTQDGRYRIARADDFAIPDWARRTLGHDIEIAIQYPIVSGSDINHDGASSDFAVIVVDKRTSDKAHFGLVVFNAPKQQGGSFDLHWVYSDRDLSRSVLSRASGWTFLTEYEDDGTTKTCTMKWNKQARRYICD